MPDGVHCAWVGIECRRGAAEKLLPKPLFGKLPNPSSNVHDRTDVRAETTGSVAGDPETDYKLILRMLRGSEYEPSAIQQKM